MKAQRASRRSGEPRVLLVVSSTERRGAEVFATSLAEALTGIDVPTTVIALTASEREGHLALDVAGGSRWNPLTLMRLTKAARRHDVIVSNGGTTLIPTLIAATTARRPFVYRNIGDPTVWGRARFAGIRVGIPLRRAAAIAALYPAAASEIISRYGVSDTAVRVIPNAAPSADFVPADPSERQRLRSAFRMGDERLWVAFVGALSEEKQPLLAIDAVMSDPRLGLIVAGDGPLRMECERRAAGAAAGTVLIVGTHASVAEIYGVADVVVIPSRTEGIPAAAIEAGMCAVPVVANDVGGISHVVVDEVTGRLMHEPSPLALAEALHDAAGRRLEMGAAASRRCHDEFSIESITLEWASLLRSVHGSDESAQLDHGSRLVRDDAR